MAAALIVVVWGVTGTTIVTFLMVFFDSEYAEPR
jgi:hypothetical protein